IARPALDFGSRGIPSPGGIASRKVGLWFAGVGPRCVTAHIPVAKVTSAYPLGWSGEIEILVRNRPKRRDSFQEDAWSHRRNRHRLSATIRTPTERLMSARLVPFVPERSVFSHGRLVLRSPDGRAPENTPDTGAVPRNRAQSRIQERILPGRNVPHGRSATLLNPSLIVEVIPRSTEFYDRVRKFEHYRSVESVTEYLLVSSERVSAERSEEH